MKWALPSQLYVPGTDAFCKWKMANTQQSVFTWIIVPYVFFTEKMSGLHSLYHIIAVLVLEGWMVIMWLACFASVAARRATFVVPTSVDDCYSDGSLIGSNHCFRKRGVVLFKGGQAGMSAAAGLGALNW